MILTARRKGRRRSSLAAAVVLGFALVGMLAAIAQAGSAPTWAGPEAGIVFAHGQAPAGRPVSSPLLVYHGGPVMHGATVTSIFWGPKWSDSSFAGDKITGLDSFFAGVGGSSYAGTNTEYYDAKGLVSSSVSFGTHILDPTATANHAPSTSDVLGVVQRNITNPVSNGYYPVYSDQPRGHARYCAWHSWGTISGVTVQFAFFFTLDGDPGCDPGGAQGGHSQGLTALGNVSGHELSEMLTDPNLNAWYDSSGAENADKCAWTFGTSLLTLTNRSQWRIQGNWSNTAYDNNTGYSQNGHPVVGCIDGTN
jgi:hypothetical protein